MVVIYVVVGLAVLALLGLASSVRVLKQYERGLQFRLGRVNGREVAAAGAAPPAPPVANGSPARA